MFVRMVIGSLVSTIVLMAWGFVFWTILPFPEEMWKGLPSSHEEAVIRTLKENLPESGVYISPLPPPITMTGQEKKAAEEVFQTKHKAGPLVQIFYHKDGLDPMAPMSFVFGCLHYFVSAFLASLLLVMALHSLPSFFGRVAFILLAGVFAAVFIDGLMALWLHHDWKYQLYSAGFHASNWLLVGIILGVVIRPKSAS
jgi:hypothetical protein